MDAGSRREHTEKATERSELASGDVSGRAKHSQAEMQLFSPSILRSYVFPTQEARRQPLRRSGKGPSRAEVQEDHQVT